MASKISAMAVRNLVARHGGVMRRGFDPLSRCLHGGSAGILVGTLDRFSRAESWGRGHMHCQETSGSAYWNCSSVLMRWNSTVSGKAVIDEIEGISLSEGEQKSPERKEEMAISQPAGHHDLEKLKEKGLVYSSYWGIFPAKVVREDGSVWPWNSFRPWETYAPNLGIDLKKHHVPKTFSDKVAYWTVKALRFPTDVFFQRRYGCRAMMLETVAAVPGMVGGMLLHCKSLRKFQHSGGWIKALIEEAENERMHLMTFMEVAKPKWYERALVFTVQGIFFNAYFMLYVLSPKLAHRLVGYLEEEAIHSYTEFLKEVDNGNIPNVPAPAIAIDYWRLPKDSTLRDVVMVVRADEAHHRDVNHFASDIHFQGRELREAGAPIGYH